MGTIVGTTGYVRPVLIITLHDLQDTGEVLSLNFEIDYNTTYEFQVYNTCDGMLYKVKGKLTRFGSDPESCKCKCEANKIDWIIIDQSTDKESKLTKINIANIKSITQINELN